MQPQLRQIYRFIFFFHVEDTILNKIYVSVQLKFYSH